MIGSRFARVVALSVVIGGCGGGDDGGVAIQVGDCMPTTPCGGDPTGTWTLASECIDLQSTEQCPGSTVDYSDQRVSGTFTFGDDGVLSTTGTIAGVVRSFTPASCLPPTFSCEQLNTPGSEDAPAFACTTGVDGCDCTMTFDRTGSTAGTWSVSGTTLTLTEDGDEPDALEFCVRDDVLTIRFDPAAEGDPTLTATMTR